MTAKARGGGSAPPFSALGLRTLYRVVANALIGLMYVFGAVAVGCTADQAQTAPAPLATAIPQSPAAPPVTMPGGWRGLKFGMSETDVKRLIYEERKDASVEWARSETTHLPTVRLTGRQIDRVLVDGKRFHEWSIRELDDGAEVVHAWHDRGRLIAIQVKGRASPDAFSRKASEAYGAPAQTSKFKFFDDSTKAQEIRDVALWHGDEMTAFVWTSASSPMLLLWSNAAMDGCASEYQSALDAPAKAARKAAQVSEDGTKF